MQVQMAGGCAGRAELAAPASPAAQATPAVPVVPARHAGHADGQAHHHHTHAPASRHEHGHHLLQVEDLSVGFLMYDPDAESFFGARKKVAWAIERMSIAVHAGEIVAVVGASGSGKTLLADAVMGLFEPNAVVRGRVWFDGEEQDAASLARLRGRGLSLVPQSVNCLDPLMKVGRQVQGRARGRQGRRERAARQRELFARYGLAPEAAELYPHELSGGMARRVLLCCALMDDPRVIIADEPTPGLDLDLAVRALDDFRAFADAGGGVMLVTHDIELALRVADRVAVFKDGTVVEETAVASFASPDTLEHPFSKALWHALPEHGFQLANPPVGDRDARLLGQSSPLRGRRIRLAGASVPSALQGGGGSDLHGVPSEPIEPAGKGREGRDGLGGGKAPMLEVRGVTYAYPGAREPLYRGFDLAVGADERVALSAPSGFGKTTLCRLLAGYERPQAGKILVDGEPLPQRGVCPVQLIGQHPERAVDPRMRMAAVLEEAGDVPQELLRDVGIRKEWLSRYPHELSGGELQRFCIVRALAANPRYVVADEVSTMLDAVTQAQIWEFLLHQARERGMGLVFVSHSPALAARIATRTVDLTACAGVHGTPPVLEPAYSETK